MKIFKLDGGLGNQMFQYAFSSEIEKRTHDSIKFDMTLNNRWTVHNGIELEKVFNITLPSADIGDVNKLATKSTTLFNRIRKKIFRKKSHIVQKKFNFDPYVFDKTGNLYYDGFWQSEKYFSQVRQEVKKAFDFSRSLSEKNKQLLESMERPVAFVHVRRGDYVTSSGLNVCTPEYYTNALSYLCQKTTIKTFLVFSDDIEWCKKNLILPSQAVFVDWNKKEDSWQDMALMTKCNHAIMANSSFSWWGAWLISDKEKIVTVPYKWFNLQNRYYTNAIDDIAPFSWIKIHW